jgi:integrase
VTSHYQNREEFFDGNVVIFRRGDAVSKDDNRVWQARFKIDGMIGFKTVSLRTRNHYDAVAKAKSLYLQFSQTVKDGGTLSTRTFAQAWREWYDYMLDANAWSADRQKWHLNYFNRYFNAYFGERKLDEITSDIADGYWNWRRRYWAEGEGVKQIAYNRRRKGQKTHSTHNAKQTPAYKTLAMEQSALNQFFDWCFSTKRYLRYPVKLKVVASKKSKNEGRRATFTNLEWTFLTRNLGSWAAVKGKYANDQVNEWHRHHRQQLRFFVLFLANTGIRLGTETRFMKWEDIEFREDNLKIRIREKTKIGKSRDVISQPGAVAYMTEWRSISHYNKSQDYVWYGMSKLGQPQMPSTDLNKTFQAFLGTVDFHGRKDGLLFDADGKRRSLYSVRHFYATQRVRHGVTYEDLARNMGTGIPQLVKHYDWATAEQRAAEITKTKFKEKKPVNIDQFVAGMTEKQKTELIRTLRGEPNPADKSEPSQVLIIETSKCS